MRPANGSRCGARLPIRGGFVGFGIGVFAKRTNPSPVDGDSAEGVSLVAEIARYERKGPQLTFQDLVFL